MGWSTPSTCRNDQEESGDFSLNAHLEIGALPRTERPQGGCMNRLAAPVVALLALATAGARADGTQAYLGIFAETASMKMAGMAAPPGLPAGFKLPPGVKLPPGAENALRMFQPHRNLTVRLWSPGIAAESASASLAVPDGLKLG